MTLPLIESDTSWAKYYQLIISLRVRITLEAGLSDLLYL
jgi:hypothetical protein